MSIITCYCFIQTVNMVIRSTDCFGNAVEKHHLTAACNVHGNTTVITNNTNPAHAIFNNIFSTNIDTQCIFNTNNNTQCIFTTLTTTLNAKLIRGEKLEGEKKDNYEAAKHVHPSENTSNRRSTTVESDPTIPASSSPAAN